MSKNKAKIEYFLRNRALYRVYIVSTEQEEGWENPRHLCKPETQSRVCITFENSPNPPRGGGRGGGGDGAL